ncbi:DUF6686 family protein [Methylobacter sp.]|uniref:DUF6686 family protein n=1 Tax=Methylobacter sp. TaxID=2051955 RepID=UPI002FDD5210
MNKKTCTHEYLAATEFGQVLICRECGKVHLHLQNLSLQFSVESFIGLTSTLNEATGKIMAQSKKTKLKHLMIVK